MMRRFVLVLLLLATPAAGQSRPAPRTFSQDDLRKAEAARDTALARVKKLEAASAAVSRDVSSIDADLLVAAADATAPRAVAPGLRRDHRAAGCAVDGSHRFA